MIQPGPGSLSASARQKLDPLAREGRPSRPTIIAIRDSAFAGPSGTGKTLAAEVIATLGKPVLRPGKYIGETEKQLRSLLASAESTGSVLFFDEADALFGKVTSARNAHDRYANFEISYLIEAMGTRGIIAILIGLRVTKPGAALAARCRWIDIP
ncbi:MAG: ATP-binding protein [Bryobacterales bacterium]|nr:ATP-binding protein [Bryobacterales bacterium]